MRAQKYRPWRAKRNPRSRKPANKAEQEITSAAQKLESEIEEKGAAAIKEIEEAAPDIAEKVLEEIEDALIGLWEAGLVDKVVDIAQLAVLNKPQPLRLSFIELKVDIHDKIDVIQRSSHRLPRNRADIIQMVHDLTDDDTIVIHLDSRLLTSALGFDIPIPIPIKALTDEADKIFGKFGL